MIFFPTHVMHMCQNNHFFQSIHLSVRKKYERKIFWLSLHITRYIHLQAL